MESIFSIYVLSVYQHVTCTVLGLLHSGQDGLSCQDDGPVNWKSSVESHINCWRYAAAIWGTLVKNRLIHKQDCRGGF